MSGDRSNPEVQEDAGPVEAQAQHPGLTARYVRHGAHLAGANRSPISSRPTLAPMRASGDGPLGEIRCGENTSVITPPVSRSVRTIAAMVPPVRPHFEYPAATGSRVDTGVYASIIGVWS